MTAKGLLDRKDAAGEPVTEDDIRAALKDSYCRCTGYQSVINAILQASGQDVPPYLPETQEPGLAIGKAQPNPNALAKITRATPALRMTTNSPACSTLVPSAPVYRTHAFAR